MTTKPQILRLPEIQKKLSVSRSTVYKIVKAGDFPSPLQLSPRSIGWIESEVDAWLETKANQRA